MHEATELVAYNDVGAALARIKALYDESVGAIRTAFERARRGEPFGAVEAHYPYLGIEIGIADLHVDARLSYGVLLESGKYGTTLTRPDLFGTYYAEQMGLLAEHHRVPVLVGRSRRPIPLPFVIEEAVTDIAEAEVRALQEHFALPDLSATDDVIANGDRLGGPDEVRPLALFTAERVDYSLARLHHYTGTSPEHFQSFVLLTNFSATSTSSSPSAARSSGATATSPLSSPGMSSRRRRPREGRRRRGTCRKCRRTT